MSLKATKLILTMNDSDRCKNGIINVSDTTAAEEYLYTPIEDLFFTVVLPYVVFVGVSANSAFIFTIIRVKEMQTITNAYVTNVAVADLIFVGVSCSLYITSYSMTSVRKDVMFTTMAGCFCSWLLTCVTYFASLFIITLVIAEKYFAICHPLQHLIVSGKKRTTRLIIASWILGIAFGVGATLRYATLHQICVIWPDTDAYDSMPLVIQECTARHPMQRMFSDSIQIYPFIVVLVSNIFMYARIIFALSSRPIGNEEMGIASATSQSAQALRVRNQVARLLIINGVIFFACQTPYRLIPAHSFWETATGRAFLTETQYGGMAVISRCLVLINSCINPFIYYTTSAYYRNGFHRAFCRREDKKKIVNTLHTS